MGRCSAEVLDGQLRHTTAVGTPQGRVGWQPGHAGHRALGIGLGFHGPQQTGPKLFVGGLNRLRTDPDIEDVQMLRLPHEELPQSLGGTQDPVQGLAGVLISRGQLPQARVLLDQPDQGLESGVRAGGHGSPANRASWSMPFKFRGSEEPFAFFEVTESG